MQTYATRMDHTCICTHSTCAYAYDQVPHVHTRTYATQCNRCNILAYASCVSIYTCTYMHVHMHNHIHACTHPLYTHIHMCIHTWELVDTSPCSSSGACTLGSEIQQWEGALIRSGRRPPSATWDIENPIPPEKGGRGKGGMSLNTQWAPEQAHSGLKSAGQSCAHLSSHPASTSTGLPRPQSLSSVCGDCDSGSGEARASDTREKREGPSCLRGLGGPWGGQARGSI